MIDVKNLSFSYGKKVNLFSGLDLTLPVGNIYGLLGKNGAGKTTLLKIICGLLFPQEGTSSVNGLETRKRAPELLRELFFIPEEFFVPAVNINQYKALYSPFYTAFDEKNFQNYIDEFELDRKQLLSKMSYGQKKKFLIAFGLAAGTKLLILDEPTNGLDIPSKSQFRKLLAYSLTEDRVFLISTHQVRDMQNLIDPIIILDDGKIIFQADSEQISDKISVTLTKDEADIKNSLYSEKTPGGYIAVKEKKNKEEAQVDLELLFNAVIANKEKMSSLFQKRGVK